jgi:hypothetical protein
MHAWLQTIAHVIHDTRDCTRQRLARGRADDIPDLVPE